MLDTVRPVFTKFLKNARIKQASVWSKFKVILMVVVIIWHRLDNIHSKRNLMLYASGSQTCRKYRTQQVSCKHTSNP